MKEKVNKVHKDAKESSKNATKTKTDALILEQDIRDALNKSRSK
jgi:large-conductance mechanosensitive channel